MLSLKVNANYIHNWTITLSGRVILQPLADKQEIHLFEKPRGYKLKKQQPQPVMTYNMDGKCLQVACPTLGQAQGASTQQ